MPVGARLPFNTSSAVFYFSDWVVRIRAHENRFLYTHQ
jgi:hypothetical protein